MAVTHLIGFSDRTDGLGSGTTLSLSLGSDGPSRLIAISFSLVTVATPTSNRCHNLEMADILFDALQNTSQNGHPIFYGQN